MSFRKTIAILGVLLASATCCFAQKVGIKSNLLMDATLNPTIGLEVALSRHWTFDANYQINAWNIHDRKLKHYIISPSFRWWFCERFQGSFWSIHALGGQFNMGNIPTDLKFLGTDFGKLRNNRYEGWGAGAGISYGYAWPLAKHWNMEFEIGVGWAYIKYKEYPCGECGTLKSRGHHNYVGPTKLGLNLEYLF